MDRAAPLRFAAALPVAAAAADAAALGFDAALLPGPAAPSAAAATAGLELIAEVEAGAVDGAGPAEVLAGHGPRGVFIAAVEPTGGSVVPGSPASSAAPGSSAWLAELRARPLDDRPTIYAGGAAEPAVTADVWIVDGQPHRELRRRIAAARRGPRPAGVEPLRFGLSALVIARETDAAASIALARLWERDDRDRRPPAFGSALADLYRRFPHVGARGGSAAGLVGSYATVAGRIRELHALGIELLVVEIDPSEGGAGLTRFAEHVIPLVRRSQPAGLGDAVFTAASTSGRERRTALAV